jgi:hypothetical protein
MSRTGGSPICLVGADRMVASVLEYYCLLLELGAGIVFLLLYLNLNIII